MADAPSPAPVSGGIPTRGLPARGGRRLAVLLARALHRRCPYCGSPGIFAGWFSLRERCPTCGVAFEREDGYFLGAYAVNLLIAEFLGMGLAVLLLVGTDLPLRSLVAVAAVAAVGLPILFFPYARTLWMALDLLLDPPERQAERRLRGGEVRRQSYAGSSRPRLERAAR